jgi:hypothetical protein
VLFVRVDVDATSTGGMCLMLADKILLAMSGM